VSDALTVEQRHTLADLFAGDGVPPTTDALSLDWRAFPKIWQAYVALVKAGYDARTEVLPMLSAEMTAEVTGLAPDKPPVIYSNWAHMAEMVGAVSWEWHNWLPAGMLTMLVGEQATGKSILALRIAACYLRGAPWPDGTPFTGETGAVLWCEAEASQGMNVDRAKRWGLPIERILAPTENPLDDVLLQNEEHMEAIGYMASRDEVRLVVVDSLSGANTAKENDSHMVHVVKDLANIAKTTGKPFILIHHLRKRGLMDNAESVTIDRIRGSGAIVQPARVVWAVDAPDPNDRDTRRLSIIKNNLVGLQAEPLGMTIAESGVAFGDAPEPPREETLQDKAADLLLALLRKGPQRATEVYDEVEQAGLSRHAAKRAKKGLGVVSVKRPDGWWWSLPAYQEETDA